jgi:glycosyltransferase involved in cell wall biosynthesis
MLKLSLSPLFLAWGRHERLILVDDLSGWVISEEIREVGSIARGLGIPVLNSRWLQLAKDQAAFFGSHFSLLLGDLPDRGHRLGTAYFHGRPGTGPREFDATYENLRKQHQRIDRIQVSHSEMRDVILESGISSHKVFLIPIAINLAYFSTRTLESRKQARAELGIPESAVVVGSFQKDGVGWGEGMEPKPIKGPDIFVRTVEILRERIPELFVLLSGPARGYVIAGLNRMNVPFKHVYLKTYPEVGRLYQALDVYIVSSRQEGGPKAVLESMAAGIPLVTTRVGQAMDLVQHGINGWMVDVGDAEGLAHWAEHAIRAEADINRIRESGFTTARANSYESQIPLWKKFMEGFVGTARS